ncbi:hypothetical protein [Actinomadura rupiterrae]|uniref:hypothetical protein n=1 Tax=Actinomadura rupiterrae TaxID=559627 RepID=UPI0020A47847|nr:hypothetical protein [Actinomadura rupiterrae]MCP2335312.1 hypothetical protein [Actinomadura rupiterrae]
MTFQRRSARAITITAFLPPLAAAAVTSAPYAQAAEAATARFHETTPCGTVPAGSSRTSRLDVQQSCGSPDRTTPGGTGRAETPGSAEAKLPGAPGSASAGSGTAWTGVDVTVRSEGAARPGWADETCCWRYVRPDGVTGESVLTGISAPSPNAGWAVGRAGNAPLVLSWTGTRWRREAPPLRDRTRLSAVSSRSADDAWIVGSGDNGYARAVHWNGRSWVSYVLPAAGGTPIIAKSVSERAPGDVWAVGSANGFAGTMAVAWHFDGRTWRVTPTHAGPGSALNAVSADASDDAWAVGTEGSRQLLLHWDGHTWKATKPPVSAVDATPSAVTAHARNNVWVVGRTQAGAPLVEHWNGRVWTVVPSPVPKPGRITKAAKRPPTPQPGKNRRSNEVVTGATGVVSDGAGGIWISGTDADLMPYLAHYTGKTWRVSRPPLPTPDGPRIQAGNRTATAPSNETGDTAGTGAGYRSSGASGTASGLALVPGTREVRIAGAFGGLADAPTHALTWTNAPRPR